MDIVELGGARLHLLAVHPGLPGEADRTMRALARLAPAVILADLDTEDALRLRASFSDKKRPYEAGVLDSIFAAQTRERYAGDSRPSEDPLVTAARFARDKHADLLPIRPIAPRPSFLARRRIQRAARSIDSTLAADAFAQAFADTLEAAGAWHPTREVEAAHPRIVRALRDGRAPVVAVVQAHRRGAYEDAVLATERIPA